MDRLESLEIQPNIYYTVEETAQLLRVSKQSALELLRSGRANGIKIGRQWRILGISLLNLSLEKEDPESLQIADWGSISARSLQEVWDNEEDAIYDNL